MQNFLFLIEEELAEQERRLKEAERVLARAPEGYLKCKERKSGKAFYRVKASKQEQNITRKPMVLGSLVRKRIHEKVRETAETNIKYLKKLREKYRSNDLNDILPQLMPAYRTALDSLPAEKRSGKLVIDGERYVQAYFDPKKHIHETITGIRTRSKSEAIIVNALARHGIPFSYDARFPYPDEAGIFYRPDFTFDLPDGTQKIWEHLGMLGEIAYCEHNAHKLHLYQQNGYVIGRNLILTMDDNKGNCGSGYIDEVIRTQLLPFFR